MSFTVVPLHNLTLPRGTRIPFGKGFVLTDIPEWVLADETAMADLSSDDRRLTTDASHALVAEYRANSWGYPDPEWKGTKPKSIQDLHFQAAMLANMAIWLIRPCPIRFIIGLHFLTSLGGQELDEPLVQPISRENPLCCHPRDFHGVVTAEDLSRAGRLHVELSKIGRLNSVWEALRAFWAGLTMYPPDYRYPFFWLGLEALFGDKDYSKGFTKRLWQRIAVFIADNKDDAKSIYDKAQRCYKMRSTIVHGRWENDPALDDVMYDTEAIWRTGLRLLMDRPDVLAKFNSADRDQYLKQLRAERLKAGWL
jgi:hypothetical protein